MAIRLSIKLDEFIADSVVAVSGYEVEPIDDEMAQVFGLPRAVLGRGSDDRIWSYLAKRTGRVPNEFYLSDPINGSDWVRRENWTPFKDRGMDGVRIERVPLRGRIVSATGEPKQIATDMVRNPPESRTNQTGSVTLSEDVTESYSRTREKNWSIGMTQSIGIEVEGGIPGLGKGKVSRSMSLSFGTGGSDSKTQSHSRTLGQSRTADYDVPPGRVHEYSLTVGSGSIEVNIDYAYRIIGLCSASYKKPLGGGHNTSWFDFAVTDLLSALGQATQVETRERLSIGLVSDATLDRFPRDFTEADRV